MGSSSPAQPGPAVSPGPANMNKLLLLLLGIFLLSGIATAGFWGDVDSDQDGLTDAVDDDDDGDGIPDDEEDYDGDGLSNEDDPDDDGDGVLDGDEDDDGDGLENDEDPDDDNDGVMDEDDEL